MTPNDLFTPETEGVTEERVNEIINSKNLQQRTNNSFFDPYSHEFEMTRTHAYLVFFADQIALVDYWTNQWHINNILGSGDTFSISGNIITFGTPSGATPLPKGIVDLSN